MQELAALWRSRALLLVLTQREIAARHAGTAFGIVWPYLQPLLVVGAYYLVLDVVFAMRLGAEAPVRAVGAFLIVGSLPWMAFCDALSRGANSLLDAGSILQKNALPAVLFPVRSVLASAAIFWPLILLVAACYAPFHRFSWALLALPLLLILQCVLSMVLAYLLAIFSVALRDTAQLISFFRGAEAAWPFTARGTLANPMLVTLDGLHEAPVELIAALDAYRCRASGSLELLVHNGHKGYQGRRDENRVQPFVSFVSSVSLSRSCPRL